MPTGHQIDQAENPGYMQNHRLPDLGEQGFPYCISAGSVLCIQSIFHR